MKTTAGAMSGNLYQLFVEYDDVIHKYVLWAGARWMVLNATTLPDAHEEVNAAFAAGIMPQIVDIIIHPRDNDPTN